MNTQHLQYLTEIERVRSISQAAENLYIGQPNLSRILRELEESAGFPIFERTSKGVRPTERGEKYLQHARSILREMEAMDALGPRHPVANRFRVCLPRSGELFDLTARYLASLDPERSLDASIRECHVRQALEMLASGEAELGIIRFRTEYREYFEEQTRQRELGFRILGKFRYQLVMAGRHPLAAKQTIVRADLAGFPEIVHGDTFRVHNMPEDAARRSVYTVDRLAQLSLLETLPDSYLWSAPLPGRELARWRLIQKVCQDNPVVYHDALIYTPQYAMTELESGFMEFLEQQKQNENLPY